MATDDGSALDLNSEISSAFNNVPDVIQALIPATTPGRGLAGVSSVYSDAYTDVSISWSVSSGGITDTVIASDSDDTSKKVTGADSVTIAYPTPSTLRR